MYGNINTPEWFQNVILGAFGPWIIIVRFSRGGPTCAFNEKQIPDQVARLRGQGIKAAIINGPESTTGELKDIRLGRCKVQRI